MNNVSKFVLIIGILYKSISVNNCKSLFSFHSILDLNVDCCEMEVAKVTMLNDLNSYSNNYSIRVKIVSTSRKMMNQNKNETYRLDMIFMDEMGNMIQASCLHKLLERFEEFLQLDECIQITKPSLAANFIDLSKCVSTLKTQQRKMVAKEKD
ncbi:putative nucleic acid-binding protein [Helianthus debilis subsp. tardiflorus]